MRDVINVQVRAGMEMAESFLHENELDEIRYLISDDHLYRFVLTQIISFLHIWLDYLAFRDEVGFYVGRTDMGGLSVSSILSRFAAVSSFSFDGGGTSWLVLISVGSGVAADLFKVWKVLKPGFVPRFPFVTVRDPSRLSSTEKETSSYDNIARTYLSLLLYPLIVGSALYALKFYEYSSWWSWLISNLANAVYTFGFISLCPQLYVNYRLKSVAHMPTRVFMYKIFNTFVDDVFAFLIEMPLKHKLMTLRDDIVFLGFLVQAYMYRVDKTRANEYGFAYDELERDGEGGGTCKLMEGEKKDAIVLEKANSSRNTNEAGESALKKKEEHHPGNLPGSQLSPEVGRTPFTMLKIKSRAGPHGAGRTGDVISGMLSSWASNTDDAQYS
eukprot:CAMPEP_0181069084 /NCGR_PEP_ID=MMETSP1070-20121207/26753_1 /TAXON_ID=265543 /ORGANISM="Minutocellus polymorphus, Strain NH13" /LENGTH=385 /DNA_ID=CAMNT_0023149857 /DNA_START=1 /DNA_END=1157 /DNA_ORIENTATION=-